MRDEDFVLGYVTGYNDGVQSGGGSGGGKFDNIPLLKKYSFVGTDYGIGVVDVNNEMFDVPYNFPNWSVYEPDKVIFCPYPDGVSRRIRIAVLKNGKVVGLLMISNGDLRIQIPYQYDPNTCVWNRVGSITTEKIENVSVTVTEKIYNNGNYIEKKLVFGYDKCKYFDDVLKSTSSYTQEIVSKSRSISSSGTSLNSAQYMVGDMLGVNDISNDDFRSFLSAWSDCTGIEEVI